MRLMIDFSYEKTESVNKCNYCYKIIVFTEQKIEKIKQKTPGTNDEYFILCEFCKKGHMEPPTFIMTSGLFDNF